VEPKRAAHDPALSDRFKHDPLKSSRVQQIKALAKSQWTKEWATNSTTAKQLRRITSKEALTNRPKIYNCLPSRKSCTMIAQLWTGHCVLNHYLHRFGNRYRSYCGCGYGKETVEHFLLECKKYWQQRKILRENVGPGKMRLTSLLGDEKIRKHTVTYIKETKRLK